MREPQNKTSRRWVAGGLLLALALLGGSGLWLLGGEDTAPMQPAVATPWGASGPTSPGAAASTPAPAASLAVGTVPSAAAPPGLSAMQLAQIEAQWCTHGMQAHRQSEASVFQGAGSSLNSSDVNAIMDYGKAIGALPTSQARRAVQQRLLVGWVDRLQRLGDPRSQATALYLQVEHGAGGREVAEAAFRQQAATTRDPYVLHLWRQHDRACSLQGACTAVPASRWSAIEPDNLLAWLPPGFGAVSLTSAQWEGLSRAKYLRSYQYELQAVLLALAQDLRPGLELDVALEFIAHMAAAQAVSADRVLAACQAPAVRQAHRQACLHGAELLWTQAQPSLMDVAKALGLARVLDAEGEGAWPVRMAEAQALGNINTTEFHLMAAGSLPKPQSCDGLPLQRERLAEVAKAGSWRLAQRDRAAATTR